MNVAVSDALYPQPLIEVRPSNPAACAVTILAREKQIDLLFGPEETLREIFFSGEDDRLREVQACSRRSRRGTLRGTGRGQSRRRHRDGPFPRRASGLRPPWLSALGPARLTQLERHHSY